MVTPTVCTIEGCERPHKARGWCLAHYKRWKAHGDPLGGGGFRTRGATCSIEGCDRPHSARGWCQMHHRRWQVSGNPMHEHKYPPLVERFWAKVDVRGGDECWLWTGATDSHGYGQIQTEGRHEPAHRVALKLAGFEIAPREFVRHDCDNPPCVNIRHLRTGSPSDNMQDAVRRGRHVNPHMVRETWRNVPAHWYTKDRS